MKGLKGRTALVTGATGLLGGAIAMRLAAEQATVAVTSRDFSKVKRWAEQNECSGGRYVPVRLDLADRQSIRTCLDHVADQAGVPTIIVANSSLRAGLGGPFVTINPDSLTNFFPAAIP